MHWRNDRNGDLWLFLTSGNMFSFLLPFDLSSAVGLSLTIFIILLYYGMTVLYIVSSGLWLRRDPKFDPSPFPHLLRRWCDFVFDFHAVLHLCRLKHVCVPETKPAWSLRMRFCGLLNLTWNSLKIFASMCFKDMGLQFSLGPDQVSVSGWFSFTKWALTSPFP